MPGLTFDVAKSGESDGGVRRNFETAVKELDAMPGVHGIAGDCGFLITAPLAKQLTRKPIFLSALRILPAILTSFSDDEQLAIFTANGAAFAPIEKLTAPGGMLAGQRDRFVIVGCENVAHFGAEVATGKAIDPSRAAPGLVQLARKAVRDHPKLRGVLLEYSQMPPPRRAARRDGAADVGRDARNHALPRRLEPEPADPEDTAAEEERGRAPAAAITPTLLLELAPTPAQLTKGIVFNTDMGGGGLYSTWHYYSVLHILLSFGMLLFWWLMFFFRTASSSSREGGKVAVRCPCRIAWL